MLSKRVKLLYFFLLLAFVILPTYALQPYVSGKITLLAVDKENNVVGSTLTLELMISEGDGSVYFDSFPISKLDTVASLRFAKEFSCDFLRIDCSKLNFYYKIKTDTFVVEGPSAGISFTILTILLLDKLMHHQYGEFDFSNIAATGTINSGGYVGPVGGLKGKINAALLNMKIDYIFVPNEPINDSKFNFSGCKKFGFKEVCKVNTIYDIFEALNLFPQKVKKFRELIKEEIKLPNYYTQIMKSLADELCRRSEFLLKDANKTKKSVFVNKNKLDDRYKKGILAYESGNYYSAASLCLTSNIALRKLYYIPYDLVELNLSMIKNDSKKIKSIYKEITELAEKYNDHASKLLGRYLKDYLVLENKKIYGITDFQTKLIVLERLNDAIKNLKESKELFENVSENKVKNISEKDLINVYVRFLSAVDKYAYAIERRYTVDLWARFFGHDNSKVEINDQLLKNLCLKKLSEAYERYNFIHYYLSTFDYPDDIKNAEKYYHGKDYALCIFYATKAKAQLNAYMSFSTNLSNVVNVKLKLLKAMINDEISQGFFPILGYSYYEYAKSLKDFDKESAYLFSENGLELGQIHIYFRNDLKTLELDNEKNESSYFYCSLQIDQYRKMILSVLVLFVILFILYLHLLFKFASENVSLRKKAEMESDVQLKTNVINTDKNEEKNKIKGKVKKVKVVKRKKKKNPQKTSKTKESTLKKSKEDKSIKKSQRKKVVVKRKKLKENKLN